MNLPSSTVGVLLAAAIASVMSACATRDPVLNQNQHPEGSEFQEFFELCSEAIADPAAGTRVAKRAGWKGKGVFEQNPYKENQRLLVLSHGSKTLTLIEAQGRSWRSLNCSIKESNPENWDINAGFSERPEFEAIEEPFPLPYEREARDLGTWRTTLNAGARVEVSGSVDEATGYYLRMLVLKRTENSDAEF